MRLYANTKPFPARLRGRADCQAMEKFDPVSLSFGPSLLTKKEGQVQSRTWPSYRLLFPRPHYLSRAIQDP
jgi:hypothetical protein